MTAAQHCCDVVHLINARREKITACNSVFAPLVKDPDRQREVAEAEAAPFKADSLPPILSQREIDAADDMYGIAAWLVMFAATTVVVAIITAFDYFMGAM
jgi:hypothetical protein